MGKPDIPKGSDKDSIYKRREIIVENLEILIGQKFSCKAFGSRLVEFNFYSVDETAMQASQNYESTMAALEVVKALKSAWLVKTSLPVSSKQKKRKFKRIYELASVLKKIGKVKIIIGERNNKRIFHYCITKKRE